MHKLHSLQPFSQGLEALFQPHSYWISELYWMKRLSQNFDWMSSGKKRRSRGPSCPSFFGHLCEGTTTFNFFWNDPSSDLPEPLVQYDHPWKYNKHFGQKKKHFYRWELETSAAVFSDMLIWCCDFNKTTWSFEAVSSIFRKSGKFSPTRSFYWVVLNVINLICLKSTWKATFFNVSVVTEIPVFRVSSHSLLTAQTVWKSNILLFTHILP